MDVNGRTFGAVIFMIVIIIMETAVHVALATDAVRTASVPATDAVEAGTGKCDQKNFVAGELVVKMRQGISIYDLAKTEGMSVKKYSVSTGIALLGIGTKKLTRFQGEAMTLGACILLNRRAGVAYAELNGVQKAAAAGALKAAASGAECAGSDFKAGEIVLKLRAGVDFRSFAAEKKLRVKSGPASAAGAGLVQIDIDGRTREEAMSLTRSACKTLNADPDVDFADLNKIRKAY